MRNKAAGTLVAFKSLTHCRAAASVRYSFKYSLILNHQSNGYIENFCLFRRNMASKAENSRQNRYEQNFYCV